jgi:hypothetical protein
MKKLLLLGLLTVVALTAPLTAAGTVTMSSSPVGLGLTKYTISWTSDGSGNVSANTNVTGDIDRGYFKQVRIVPGSGGTAPTAGYDVTFLDENGADMLGGQGADSSATVAEVVMYDPPYFHDKTQKYDLVIANAGAAKTGVVELWVGR